MYMYIHVCGQCTKADFVWPKGTLIVRASLHHSHNTSGGRTMGLQGPAHTVFTYASGADPEIFQEGWLSRYET